MTVIIVAMLAGALIGSLPEVYARISPRYAIKRSLKKEQRRERSLQRWKHREEQRTQRLLNWSLEHPSKQEAHAHLQKRKEDALNDIERMDRFIDSYKSIIDSRKRLVYYIDDDNKMAELTQALEEAEQERKASQDLVDRIDAALFQALTEVSV